MESLATLSFAGFSIKTLKVEERKFDQKAIRALKIQLRVTLPHSKMLVLKCVIFNFYNKQISLQIVVCELLFVSKKK